MTQSARAPDLIIRMTRRRDGGSLLHCTRRDGSVSWQRQDGAGASFFPLHDLCHFAVESELGYRHGFYGLIADGWDISDTTGKGRRGPLPAEALEVENVVGTLDVERAGRESWSAADFNDAAALQAKSSGRPAPRTLTDADIARVRSRIRELFRQWYDTPDDGTLELQFDRR